MEQETEEQGISEVIEETAKEEGMIMGKPRIRKKTPFKFIKAQNIRKFTLERDLKTNRESLMRLDSKVEAMIQEAMMRVEKSGKKIIKPHYW